jgi:hypothetical protein
MPANRKNVAGSAARAECYAGFEESYALGHFKHVENGNQILKLRGFVLWVNDGYCAEAR